MLASVLLAAAISFTPEDAALAFGAASGLVAECTPRNAGTIRGRLAAGWILDRVSRTGVDADQDDFRAETPDGERLFSNVYVDMIGSKGRDAPWIVLVSHFDTAPGAGKGFEGANDGASTSGLLVALAAAIRRAGKQEDNIALVWTDAEESRRGTYSENDGFQGAKRAVALFREKNRRVRAVIGLDMLGDKDLHITIPANGSEPLKKIAMAAAERAGLADRMSLGGDVVKDDFAQFLDAGIPAINLIDFDYGPGNSYWHTQNDTMDKISEESLLVSGRIVCEILNLLERNGTHGAQAGTAKDADAGAKKAQ